MKHIGVHVFVLCACYVGKKNSEIPSQRVYYYYYYYYLLLCEMLYNNKEVVSSLVRERAREREREREREYLF